MYVTKGYIHVVINECFVLECQNFTAALAFYSNSESHHVLFVINKLLTHVCNINLSLA